MNQVVSTANGRKILILELEPGNLTNLQADKPIRIHVEDLFPDGIPRRLDLVIAYSETPIADSYELQQRAEVVIDERRPVAEKKRPRCPQCKSTVEQYGVGRDDRTPLATVFCPACGCVMGLVPRAIFDDFNLQPNTATSPERSATADEVLPIDKS